MVFLLPRIGIVVDSGDVRLTLSNGVMQLGRRPRSPTSTYHVMGTLAQSAFVKGKAKTHRIQAVTFSAGIASILPRT